MIFVKADVNKKAQEFWLLGVCFLPEALKEQLAMPEGEEKEWVGISRQHSFTASVALQADLPRILSRWLFGRWRAFFPSL